MAATEDDGLALVEAVRRDPNDDLPRLAYADWLEEKGEQAKADFVREGVRGGAGGVKAASLQRGERWLLAAPAGVPCVAWDDRGGKAGAVRVLCERGFVTAASGPLDVLLRHGAALHRWCPLRVLWANDRAPWRGRVLRGGAPNHDWPDDLHGWWSYVPHAAITDRLPEFLLRRLHERPTRARGGGGRSEPVAFDSWRGGGVLFATRRLASEALSDVLLSLAGEEARRRS